MAVENQATNGLGIASMVTGIVSIFFCYIPIFGFIPAATALTMGLVGLSKKGGKGMAIAGIATSSFALLINLITAFIWIISIIASVS